jgi:hypothetical protein
MRRVEQLIDIARKQSGNARFDADSGVPQSVFVQYLKNAQDSLVREANNAKSKLFMTQVVQSVVSRQEFYSSPSDQYFASIDTMWWSDSGQLNYIPLYKGIDKDRVDGEVGYAFSYVPVEGGFYLAPPLESGTLRTSYIRYPNRPQKRSGQVQSLTLAGGILSALTLDITEASYDEDEILSDNYLCVVDKFGVLKARGVVYDSVASGVFTLDPFTLASGESIAVGDYICIGDKVANKPELPDPCEEYLIKHMIYEAKEGDSSNWSVAAKNEMQRVLMQIVSSFGLVTEDITLVPIISVDFLDLF